jgi:hypothetical protein
MSDPNANLTCAEFLRLTSEEQRLVIVGFANGRGLVQGLFAAYAGAAQAWVAPGERSALVKYWESVEDSIAPLLTLDAGSLLNGVRSECARSGWQDRSLIEAFASLHHRIQKALKAAGEAGPQL